MLITKRTVAYIQSAGQAIDSAAAALSENVRAAAEDMLSQVTLSPFDSASTQALEAFRQVARLGQDLIAMEQELRRIYTAAAALAAAPDALPAPAEPAPLPSGPSSSESQPRRRQAKIALSATGTVSALSDNDQRLMHYLQAALPKDQWTRLSGRAASEGSGLPTGSLGVSMRRLLAAGKVQKGQRGMYRLAD